MTAFDPLPPQLAAVPLPTNDPEDESGSSDEEEPPPAADISRAARIGLLAGPLAGLATWGLLLATRPEGLAPGGRRLAGLTVWIATWWLTEPVPLGVSALLPLCTFSPLGVMDAATTAKSYSLPLIWLFFGGFQLAFGLQRAGLHRRAALRVMRLFGTSQALLLLGVMLSVALLSMFLSNTSTTLMIVPVVQALIACIEGPEGEGDTQAGKAAGRRPAGGGIAKPMMLGVAYSASCGGLGSLIGTPPNGVLAVQGEPFGLQVTFAGWMGFAMPLSLIMVLLLWVYFLAVFRVPFATGGAEASSGERLRRLAEELGPVSQAERRVGAVFLATVLCWMFRKNVVDALGLPKGTIEDDTVAIAATVVLFLIPARFSDGTRRRLMDWEALVQTPWQILFLFGGGFALAAGFGRTGLSAWIGGLLSGLGALPQPALVLLVVLVVTFLTEITSNTATSNVLLPIIGQMAVHMGVKPALLMVPATLAASCAFMLPVATPPNAIVFASGLVPMQDMARTGLLINFLSSGLITLWMFTWGRLFFDI